LGGSHCCERFDKYAATPVTRTFDERALAERRNKTTTVDEPFSARATSTPSNRHLDVEERKVRLVLLNHRQRVVTAPLRHH